MIDSEIDFQFEASKEGMCGSEACFVPSKLKTKVTAETEAPSTNDTDCDSAYAPSVKSGDDEGDDDEGDLTYIDDPWALVDSSSDSDLDSEEGADALDHDLLFDLRSPDPFDYQPDAQIPPAFSEEEIAEALARKEDSVAKEGQEIIPADMQAVPLNMSIASHTAQTSSTLARGMMWSQQIRVEQTSVVMMPMKVDVFPPPMTMLQVPVSVPKGYKLVPIPDATAGCSARSMELDTTHVVTDRRFERRLSVQRRCSVKFLPRIEEVEPSQSTN
jgi:hypothetical protein